MSVFRKTVLASAILGAGLASTAGVAMAHEHQDAGKGCSNAVAAESSNGAGRTLGDTAGGAQEFDLSNTCDIFNGNTIGSGNNSAAGESTVTNGDTTTIVRSVTETSDSSTTVG